MAWREFGASPAGGWGSAARRCKPWAGDAARRCKPWAGGAAWSCGPRVALGQARQAGRGVGLGTRNLGFETWDLAPWWGRWRAANFPHASGSHGRPTYTSILEMEFIQAGFYRDEDGILQWVSLIVPQSPALQLDLFTNMASLG